MCTRGSGVQLHPPAPLDARAEATSVHAEVSCSAGIQPAKKLRAESIRVQPAQAPCSFRARAGLSCVFNPITPSSVFPNHVPSAPARACGLIPPCNPFPLGSPADLSLPHRLSAGAWRSQAGGSVHPRGAARKPLQQTLAKEDIKSRLRLEHRASWFFFPLLFLYIYFFSPKTSCFLSS